MIINATKEELRELNHRVQILELFEDVWSKDETEKEFQGVMGDFSKRRSPKSWKLRMKKQAMSLPWSLLIAK